jgi:hypothetical protein
MTRYELRTHNIADHKSLIAVAERCGIKLDGHKSKHAAYVARDELARVSGIRVWVAGYIPDC